ncbi:MAG: MlaD family protein [Planctomycetaceae bacterium]|nr:MlaD family protein [Planctomycetaceae bacterium]
MSDYDSIQKKRNMVVGAFVIVGLCVFVYMVFLFGELPVVTAKYTSYSVRVLFPNAPGVEESTPVQYCGYPIGKVTHVSPPARYRNPDGEYIYQVAVEMSIANDYNNIPSNVRVKLYRRGMGSSYIDISNVQATQEEMERLEPKYLKHDMVLQGEAGGSELIPEDLQNKLKTLFVKVSVLVDNVNDIVGDPNNKANLKNTLANLSKATEESITTLQSVRQFSTTANDKVIVVSDQLGETLIEIQRLMNKINSGQGTVGKLVNDDKLYYNLVESSEELKLALEKMKKVMDKTSEKGIQIKLF